jgi:Ca2+-binding EF-hand superfamily protein
MSGDTSASGVPSFSSLDKNGDGKISRAEAKADAALSKKFKELDTDKDGSLSMSEYANFSATSTK